CRGAGERHCRCYCHGRWLNRAVADRERKALVEALRGHPGKVGLIDNVAAGIELSKGERIGLWRSKRGQSVGIEHISARGKGNSHGLRLAAHAGVRATRNLVHRATRVDVKARSKS